MRPLLHSSCTSSVSVLVMSKITACQFPSGMNEKKQTSYKALMGLIVLMFGLQTIHSVCDWYMIWLGFIYYGNAPDQALDALEGDTITNLSLRAVVPMLDILNMLRLAIADSIMVSIRPSFPTSTTNNLQIKGLEMLDHMQQELGSSNHPPDLQSWVYRYVMALDDK
jgi:hypothetical protein